MWLSYLILIHFYLLILHFHFIHILIMAKYYLSIFPSLRKCRIYFNSIRADMYTKYLLHNKPQAPRYSTCSIMLARPSVIVPFLAKIVITVKQRESATIIRKLIQISRKHYSMIVNRTILCCSPHFQAYSSPYRIVFRERRINQYITVITCFSPRSRDRMLCPCCTRFLIL